MPNPSTVDTSRFCQFYSRIFILIISIFIHISVICYYFFGVFLLMSYRSYGIILYSALPLLELAYRLKSTFLHEYSHIITSELISNFPKNIFIFLLNQPNFLQNTFSHLGCSKQKGFQAFNFAPSLSSKTNILPMLWKMQKKIAAYIFSAALLL